MRGMDDAIRYYYMIKETILPLLIQEMRFTRSNIDSITANATARHGVQLTKHVHYARPKGGAFDLDT